MKKISPPRWANRFLEWYCRPELLEEIQGDAFELYERSVKTNKQKADWSFVWNVIRFFRWKNIKRTSSASSNATTMIRSYLKIGFRNALRNGATSFINVFGLAVGVAGMTTIFVFGDQFFHTDDFQQKSERLYAITAVVEQGNKISTVSNLPAALAPALQEDSPALEAVNRIVIRDGALRYQDHVFSERFYFTDKSFFTLFNYPMLEGDTRALNSPGNIVFTKRMAEKYFGDQPALGQTVSVKFSNEQRAEFTIAAVVDQPANNTMYFDFLLSMEVFESIYKTTHSAWMAPMHASFLLLKPGHYIDEVTPLMDKYRALQNESSPEWKIIDHKFYYFPDLSTRSYEIEDAVVGSGQPQGVFALGLIAFMLLLLACFNYMNISIATVATRLKEIGIRKVIGGQRKEILQQFVTENFLLCAIAIAIGFLLSYFLFMPWLNALLAYKIPFAFSSPVTMIFYFAGSLFFIVLVSGLYPALYISRFQPVIILKGKEKFGQRSRLSRVLLTLQFILAFTTIVGCFVFIDNSFYLKNKDWGYQHDQNLVVPVNSATQYIALRDKVATQKNIVSVAGAENHIGLYRRTSPIEHEGLKFEAVVYRVGFKYLETMNLRLSSGRFFDEAIQSDQVESVVVNERFVRAMGWDNPIHQTFEYDSVKRYVIGVVSDFHYTDFYREILPVLFVIAPESNMRHLALNVEGTTLQETEAWVREVWKEIAPDDPYEGTLQNDVFYNWAKNNETEIKLMGFIATITVLLACLGLFGLVSYNITRRLKEFSVRKVFGANVSQIFKLMNKDYVWILLIAFIIGAPAGLYLMDTLLHIVYIDPQSAKPTPFLLASGLMVVTVAITIGSQMNRIIKENPASTLRSE